MFISTWYEQKTMRKTSLFLSENKDFKIWEDVRCDADIPQNR